MFTEQALLAFIKKNLAEMPLNRMRGKDLEGETIWDLPVAGFAAADDALFSFYKTDIGPFYWLPDEAFSLQYPEHDQSSLTVLSLAFPHTSATLAAQRVSRLYPSDRWQYSRQYWPDFMADMSDRLIAWLAEQGIRGVDPERLPQFQWQTSGQYGYASNWSQRHTAYVCGLGTFSLSDGLITEKGKAVRFMSLILEGTIKPTVRAYSHYQEWCLFFKDGSCNQCIRRCPAGAISETGHDKALCAAYGRTIREKCKPEPNRTVGCGLCQAGVPCEHRRP
ncbi:MAG: 4Fe-4S ferredoxin [Bacillota bacterium]|nr:4Fe-4S ferredoxin [Bacillota bacterium]